MYSYDKLAREKVPGARTKSI